ncbi:MAG: phosphoglycerate mutase family protein [Pyrinomonadaceae bacterium]
MKNKVCVSLLATFAFVIFGHFNATAQTDKTIVLVRHAEKMPPVDTDKGDPDLSAEGRQRAERLAKVLKKYKPHEIFATDYKRTKQTVEPIAKNRKKEIQTYDPTKQADLVAKIMPTKTDHYLIVGHSNTIPALANLLARKELFRNLLDTEYGVFWVIRMKNGVVTKVEVFPY